MKSTTYDLFISYKSENLNLAGQLYERLIGEGFSVWFDKARLNPGCKWHAEIEAGCEASRIILPVLTPNWKESEWTKFETYGAEFVIPLLCEGDFEDAAPLPLREYQFSDFRRPDEENWSKLFASIRQYLDQEPPEKTQRLAFVPYAHNPYFVGREKSLLDIHEKLCRAPSTALTQGTAQAVSGLGGVGKTTLAREYAEKFWRLYRDILWVRADRPMVLEFQRLAEELGLIQERSQDPEDDARRAMQELSSRTRRLLIMDNAPDEESIQEWIPTTGHCRTIITSRFAGWSAAVQNIQVDVLEPVPARELLLKRSEMPESEENRESAGRVAKELGYLPLALEHAAAFVQEASISFDQYLAYYTEARSRRDLIARRVLGSTQYPDSVATTWLVTIQRLGPLARSILTLIGFLAPDDIPRSIVTEAGDFLREGILEIQPANEQDEIEVSAYALDQALAELKGFSMVSLQQESLSVHRLVQAVQRDGLNDSLQRRWAERAVRAVNSVFPKIEYSNWPLCGRLIPHAQLLASLIDKYSFDFPEAARMMNRAGQYMNERAQYAEAEFLLKCALVIREKVLGAEHPDIAESLNNLAALYYNQGNYAKAESLLQRALAIDEKTLGAEHPNVASSLSNLASLYNSQGKYAEAEPLLKCALAIREKVFDPEHPDVANSLNNLAGLYNNQGRFAEAEPLFQRALAIREKVLGAEHPDVARSFNNLATLYGKQGKYAEAESLCQRALSIREKTLGSEHPDVTQSLNNLAWIYNRQGKYAEAESLCQHALTIKEQVLGSEHPSIALGLNNLAALCSIQGKYAEAELFYQRALTIREKVLGAEHPDVATSLNNLALLYNNQSKYLEADLLYQRALAIDEKTLGAEHPNVAQDLNNLAALYRVQGKYAEAEPLLKRALAIYEKVLDPEHPEIANCLGNLAKLYTTQGKYAEVEPLFQRSLAIFEKVLGMEHPDVALSLNNLAKLYDNQGRYAEAESLRRKELAICEQRYEMDDLRIAASLTRLLRCLQEQGRHEEALPLCCRALAIREQRMEAGHFRIAFSLNNLGLSLVCLEGDDNLAEAEQHLLRATQINEKFPDPRYWLARLYQKRGSDGDREREIAEWKRYLELEPTSEERRNEADARLEDLSGQDRL